MDEPEQYFGLLLGPHVSAARAAMKHVKTCRRKIWGNQQDAISVAHEFSVRYHTNDLPNVFLSPQLAQFLFFHTIRKKPPPASVNTLFFFLRIT